MSDQDIYSNIDTGDPNDVFKVMAGIGTWGGRLDYESGQDSGETAGGKLTYDPATGEESTTPRIAVDPTWIKRGIIKYGDKVVIQNPKTGAQQEVEVQDAGPARWTGRGFDIDEGTRQSLGLETDDKAVVDFRPALLGQKPQQDLTTPEGAQSYLAQQAQNPSNMTAEAGRQSGTVQDITVTDPELEKVRKLPDGGYDLGDGVIGYPNGIFHKRAGSSVTQYTPDPTQPTGYKTNTFQVKATEQPAPPVPEGATADQAMSQLSPADRITVKELAEGKAPAFTRFGKESPNYTKFKEYAHLVNPGLDPSAYLVRQQSRMQYNSQKPTDPGGMISSYNQGIHHMDTLIGYANSLPTGSFKKGNTLKQVIAREFGPGSQEFAKYETSSYVFANELARAFKRAAPDQPDIDNWKSKLDSVQSRDGLMSVIKEAMPDLIGGALSTLDEGYTKATGESLPPDTILDKKSREALRKLGLTEFIGRDLETGKPIGEAKVEKQTGRKVLDDQGAYGQAVKILQSDVASPEMKQRAQKVLESLRLRGLLDDHFNLATPLAP